MKSTVFICFLMSSLLILGGCRTVVSNETPHGNNSATEDAPPQNVNMQDLSKYNQIFSEEIVICQVSRDTFEALMENPSYDFLSANCDDISTYSSSGGYYITQQAKRLSVQKELIDFVGNPTKINSYLFERGVAGDVCSMAVLDIPFIPLTIWINTTETDVFITINEKFDDRLYTYRFYEYQEFLHRYKGKEVSLIINNETVLSEVIPKYYHNYADVPFIATVRAFGAEITEQETNKLKIVVNDRTFILDKSIPALYEVGVKGKEKLDLFFTQGGSIYAKTVGSEVVLDSSTLCYALYSMGIKIDFNYDADNGSVIISKR